MRKLGLVLVALTTVLASCAGGAVSEESDPRGLDGVWWLTSILEGERVHTVDVGVNTARQPWLEITDRLEGSAGCNHFSSDGFEFDGERLHPGRTIVTASLCGDPDESGDDVMFVERVFTAVLFTERGIEVAWPDGIAGDSMVWTNGAVRFVFARRDGAPVPTTQPPPFSVGRLDCGRLPVIEEHIEGEAGSPEEILRSRVPATSTIEPGDPLWWWAYDDGGTVIAALAQGDITPVRYQLWTCPASG